MSAVELKYPAEVPRKARFMPGLFIGAFLLAPLVSSVDLVAGGIAVVGFGIALVRIIVRRRMDRVGVATVSFLAFQLVLGLAVGAGPSLSTLMAFLAFDGRAFVAYVPLLLFATIKTETTDLRRLRRMLRLSVWFGLALLALGLAGVPGLMQRGHFFGLTSSHHVPGLFYGTAAIALGTAPGPRHKARAYTAVLGALVVVVASGSRTAGVGLLFAALYLVVSAPTVSRRVRNVTITFLAVLLALALSGRVLSTVRFIVSEDFVSAATAEFSEADLTEQGIALRSSAPENAALSNVLLRFGVWRAGIDEFMRSPIIGIGSWRLDDFRREYNGVRGVLELSTEGEEGFAGFGAHNVVIQTLAETGIVGLALLLWPWSLLFKRFRSGAIPATESRSGIALIAYAAGTSLTGNSLISPALCFPLLVCLMTYARLRPVAVEMGSRPTSAAQPPDPAP